VVDRLATEMRVGHADPWWSGEIGCSGPSLLTLTMSVRRLDDDGDGVDGWNDVDDDAGHGYPRAPYDLRPSTRFSVAPKWQRQWQRIHRRHARVSASCTGQLGL
jgi:hypothetical protein